MFLLVRLLPLIALIAVIFIAVKVTLHFKNVVHPRMAERRESAKEVEEEFERSSKDLAILNKRWLTIENSADSELQIPSYSNFDIKEVKEFIHAKKQFSERWDGAKTETLTVEEKQKFVDNTNELEDYFEQYVRKLIEVDKPNAKYAVSILPSSEDLLS